ncbi:class I SAM-dependent methyltransferase [Leptolyngbya sp. NIES-2104]|uniref:class I SAM-dependent methyltransferase n=1 Tax=Leptolyngbya sp. NIES-2104 TaxID=1552121 RepID=UPI0006EC4568|nr:class I SAM-dependent methyltransferase [Leptolyngbya sp. NIES-2104]GAP94649.1 hypothetical protein NIES2104_11600 [Leptolyngbya sp. NIES-2104]
MQLSQKLVQLYQEEARSKSLDLPENLESFPMLQRRIEAFDLFKPYLEGQHRFLDWGCKSAETAFMIRSQLADEAIEIHGCDIAEGDFGIFAERSNLIYSQLTHPYQLPYEDNYFDVVISSGVLEHVANDFESLKELYRTIKPDGYLIITFLPNHLSYTEFLNRNFFKVAPHQRLYSLSEIRRMLLHTGFVPVQSGYHQVLPSFASFGYTSGSTFARVLTPMLSQIYRLNHLAEKTWLLNQFAANLYVIAQRRSMI